MSETDPKTTRREAADRDTWRGDRAQVCHSAKTENRETFRRSYNKGREEFPKEDFSKSRTKLKEKKKAGDTPPIFKEVHPDNQPDTSKQDRTIMMSPDDRALEDLLYCSDLGDEAEGLELGDGGRGPLGVEESAAAAAGIVTAPTAVSIQEPMMCAGCGEQVCDRFFLLAAGRVWHGPCLRCSECQCELQTHPSLYWRDGNIYCQQDYCRMFGVGQCARCYQPIPATALVMRSGDLTFHPHCFSCQECDIKLMPGNLYCMQGQSLYCQSHYHDDGSVPLSHDPQPQSDLKDEAQNQTSCEGEESVSSPEPRLDDRMTGGRTRRQNKRMRTCFRSEQLRALESYFAQKHNPDGKDWTCLAHKTGLPKRVLQVWFQNARAKLRRSLTTDESQVNSPSAPSRGATVATNSPPTVCSPPDQPQPFSTSTIDQLQLSLLTAPLSDSSVSPAISQPHQLHSPAFFLDYDSQSAPGCISSLEVFEDFGEAGGGGAEGEVDPDSSFEPHYC